MENSPQELAYDLRQKYAEIVGKHLELVAEARISKNYPSYFDSLEDLFTVVKHKFRPKSSKKNQRVYENSFFEDKKKKDNRSDLKKYKEIRQKAIDISHKYKEEFLGKNVDPNGVAEVEKALRAMEEFLYYVMDKANMFGGFASNRNL